MIAALDVQYEDAHSSATAAAVVFEHWDDAATAAEYVTSVQNVEPYVPGEFFRRELPCLLAVINKIQEPIHLIIVDGYVHLNDKPVLGQHLFEHLSRRTPVIGVAKTRFHDAKAIEVLRGSSHSPLWITAAGIDPEEAAGFIRKMHGAHRIPTLLKRADRLARSG